MLENKGGKGDILQMRVTESPQYIQLLEKWWYGYSHSVYTDSREGSEECATDKSREYWMELKAHTFRVE